MRTTFLNCVLTIATCFLISCGDKEIENPEPSNSTIPECLENHVQDPSANVTKVWSYIWENDETFYFLQSGCCDFYDELWDSECNYICSPSGGFSGAGDGLCPNFIDESCCEKLLWEL